MGIFIGIVEWTPNTFAFQTISMHPELLIKTTAKGQQANDSFHDNS